MHLLKAAFLAPCLLIAIATPALSQQTQDRPSTYPGFERYLSVLGGATLETEKAAAVAGEYGEMLGNYVVAYASYAYYENLMTDRMRGNLALAGNILTSSTGIVREFSGRDRGLALTTGAKVLFSVSDAFRPYVGAGVGGVNIHRTITESSLGDITASFVTESGLSDGVITSGAVTTTKPLAEALIGVNIIHGRTYVDVGYRRRRIFHAQSLDFSQFAVGVGVTF